GNFDFVFEDAYQKAYKPFIDVLEIHTGIKIAMHFTGSLLQWIEKHHPEFIDRIRKLVHIGKIEIVSGAFYEPILSIIPEQDAVEQLNLYTKYLADLFEYKATGLWLAERVWEPNLPSLISNTKLKYTILDESHFQSAGLSNEKINGYFLTEDKGKMLFLFPIDFKLRYTIPFKEVSDTIEYLENMADNENIDGITFADDGEKFGVWPNTYNWVYKNRWLDKFFTALEKNDKIEMITFSEFLNEYSPKDRIYIPTASYNEMMQWALGTESGMKYENFVERLKGENLFSEYKAFVKAGFWRNFFHKYHEANNIHKKMLYVSKKIRQCEENGVGRRAKSEERSAKGVVRNAKGVGRNAESDIQSAKVHLFKAQTNCPYWHGVFGGLYLPHLRYAIYQHLIAAENIIDQIEKKKWSFQHYDFDCDGAEELIFGNEMINIYIKPSSGGSVFELDYKPKCINIMNTMQRRKEAYHRRLKNASIQKTGEHQSIHNIVVSKENDIDKYLFYDWHARYSLLDHFFALDTKIENVYKCCYQEYGDFINQPY
ncbi:MAG TPA: DUF1926 domain-containing protein, partial [Bacteroidetes bacterium]|nr:DUF1926 domain-containing protein [Bacteroidota bacterium]